MSILTFTKPETRWLSNMAYCNVEHEGIIYPSTENMYQAMKYNATDMVQNTITRDMVPIRKFISKLSPSESKAFAKANPMTNPYFKTMQFAIMSLANYKKFSQEPFRSKLLATGDCHLEEGNWWHDRFWGVDIKTREGENNLGKILMQTRARLRAIDEGKQKEGQQCNSRNECL